MTGALSWWRSRARVNALPTRHAAISGHSSAASSRNFRVTPSTRSSRCWPPSKRPRPAKTLDSAPCGGFRGVVLGIDPLDATEQANEAEQRIDRRGGPALFPADLAHGAHDGVDL